MANTPSRPPAAPRSRRRPPKGPRVPRDIRARLEVNARQLTEAGHDASAIHALLAPRGWVLLRDSEPAKDDADLARTMGIFVAPALRDALKAAAERTDTTLGAVATDGLDRFVKGEWEPERPTRTRGVKKVNMSLWVPGSLVDRASEKAAADSEHLGYQLKVAWVIQSWLLDQFSLNKDGSEAEASPH